MDEDHEPAGKRRPEAHFVGQYGKCTQDFVGAFMKLRKATISLVISVRLSVRMEQTRLPTGRDSMKLSIFLKSIYKIEFLLKSGKSDL
jgi:hypothetical protein